MLVNVELVVWFVLGRSAKDVILRMGMSCLGRAVVILRWDCSQMEMMSANHV